MAQLTTQPRGLLTLTSCLLTQVEAGEALLLASVTGRPGGGLVVSGEDSLKAIEYLQWRGYPAALLADRQRYKGNRRKRAIQPFDPDWISRQRRLGLPVIIPDAGYVAKGDLTGLRLVLQRSAEIRGAVALLALADWWMHGDGLKLLLTELQGTSQPIALVLEHRDDPLGVHRILRGVLALLQAGVTLLMLRCDVSAIGLIANGALTAAYGSRTSIRHLYPMSNGGGGGGAAKESVFWPSGTALHYRDLIHDVAAASPQSHWWKCSCGVCDGKGLDRLSIGGPEEVRQHNSASLLDLRAELAALPSGNRPSWWKHRCHEAELAHAAVDAGPVALSCPKSLIWWQRA